MQDIRSAPIRTKLCLVVESIWRNYQHYRGSRSRVRFPFYLGAPGLVLEAQNTDLAIQVSRVPWQFSCKPRQNFDVKLRTPRTRGILGISDGICEYNVQQFLFSCCCLSDLSKRIQVLLGKPYPIPPSPTNDTRLLTSNCSSIFSIISSLPIKSGSIESVPGRVDIGATNCQRVTGKSWQSKFKQKYNTI